MRILEHTYPKHTAWTKRKTTNSIFLHCAATPEGRNVTVDEIDQWHRQRNFNGIGYNFIIYRDGTVVRGRDEDCVGAHASGYNSTSIGIVYIGGVAKDGKTAKDTRTPEQKQSIYKLVELLMNKYGLNLSQVHCHNEVAKKACPSFSIGQFRQEFQNYLETRNV